MLQLADVSDDGARSTSATTTFRTFGSEVFSGALTLVTGQDGSTSRSPNDQAHAREEDRQSNAESLGHTMTSNGVSVNHSEAADADWSMQDGAQDASVPLETPQYDYNSTLSSSPGYESQPSRSDCAGGSLGGEAHESARARATCVTSQDRG